MQKTVIHPGPAAYCDLVKLNGKQFGVLYEAGQLNVNFGLP
jgi:hypothetical protein